MATLEAKLEKQEQDLKAGQRPSLECVWYVSVCEVCEYRCDVCCNVCCVCICEYVLYVSSVCLSVCVVFVCVVSGLCAMCMVFDVCVVFSQPQAGVLCRVLADGASTLPTSLSIILSP